METRPSKYLENRVAEQKEKKISWKGTIGFDFIFVRDGFKKDGSQIVRPICVELNGEQSGISGKQEIEQGKLPYLERLFSLLRGRENRKIHKNLFLAKDLRENFLQVEGKQIPFEEMFRSETGFSHESWDKVQDYLKKVYRKTDNLPLFEESNSNPHFVAMVCSDKNLQSEFIPEENSAAEYVPGVHEKSSTGYWIIKPRAGMQGRDIQVLTDEELEDFLQKENIFFTMLLEKGTPNINPEDIQEIEKEIKNSNALKGKQAVLHQYNITELLMSIGADEAAGTHRNNPASMRLLLDFVVTDKGEILFEQGFAYQRVSPTSSRIAGKENLGSRIVNKATGAVSYPASKLEIELAMPVAKKIIENLHSKYILINPDKSLDSE